MAPCGRVEAGKFRRYLMPVPAPLIADFSTRYRVSIRYADQGVRNSARPAVRESEPASSLSSRPCGLACMACSGVIRLKSFWGSLHTTACATFPCN